MQVHRNNVGLLRLIFASLVIVGHAPEMADGNRAREPLTLLFHTLSLGELSVDAFFLISGYLITKSWSRTGALGDFLERRALRIYPGFIAAFLASLALAPFVGGHHPTDHLAKNAVRLVLLRQPSPPNGTLAGIPYPLLNGSLWTIFHEFRCYLLVAALGLSGLLRRRGVILAATATLLLLTVVSTFPAVASSMVNIDSRVIVTLAFGDGGFIAAVRLTAVFLVGCCALLYEEKLSGWLTGSRALLSLALGLVTLFFLPVAEIGLAVFGGIALYWLAFRARLGWLQRINDRWDVSYGTYLYGWPIASTILYLDRGIGPIALTALSLPLALLFGAASWWGVERWTKDLRRPTRT